MTGGSIVKKTNILLEDGTNELELLEFQVGKNTYGINIAKVVEISTAKETTTVVGTTDFASEIFVLRGKVVRVVDLFKILQTKPEENEREMFITCNFNELTTAFRVGKVDSIHRISWADIKKTPHIANATEAGQGMLTGVVELKEEISNETSKLILMLDFERILSLVNKAI